VGCGRTVGPGRRAVRGGDRRRRARGGGRPHVLRGADLDGALCWFGRGLAFYQNFDTADAVDDATLMQLLTSRQRVRRLLELPPDSWDDIAAGAQAVLLADLTDP
jgi:hypothetical protein